MKKFLLFIILLFINFSFADARNIYEKELPTKFKIECFEFKSSYNFYNNK
jgi:hypothetical protein